MTVSLIVHIFDIISLFAVELEEPKIGISGKGLTSDQTIHTFNDHKEEFWKILLGNDRIENIVGKRRKC